MNKTFFIICSDDRSLVMADCLLKRGEKVLRLGDVSLQEGLDRGDIVVLGLPMSKDGETISAPFYHEKIYVEAFASRLSVRHTLLAGKINPEHSKIFTRRGIQWIDYLQREELAIANAVPSAEGALEIIMKNTKTTVFGSNILVVGYGRIGKYLSKILKAMGANVTVSARRQSDFAWIDTNGFTKIHTSNISKSAGMYDVIVNTVPHTVIDSSVLQKVKSDVFILDLASSPGGTDFAFAKEHSINAVSALSLPAKVAPLSAGKIVCETVLNIVNEL